MINVLSEVVCNEGRIRNAFCTAKGFVNLNWSQRGPGIRALSAGNASLQDHRNGDGSALYEKQLPKLIYIQNPVTWLINKIDFKMLKSAWDSEFDEEDFKRGTKQAVAVICTLISKNLWDNLRGLVARQALMRLQREVEVHWSDEQRRNVYLESGDIKLALPRKVHFLRIADQKFVDVDMMCVALKFKDPLSKRGDLVLIEMMARFHRNYTAGQLPNWTVTLFKVTRFTVKSLQ